MHETTSGVCLYIGSKMQGEFKPRHVPSFPVVSSSIRQTPRFSTQAFEYQEELPEALLCSHAFRLSNAFLAIVNFSATTSHKSSRSFKPRVSASAGVVPSA